MVVTLFEKNLPNGETLKDIPRFLDPGHGTDEPCSRRPDRGVEENPGDRVARYTQKQAF